MFSVMERIPKKSSLSGTAAVLVLAALSAQLLLHASGRPVATPGSSLAAPAGLSAKAQGDSVSLRWTPVPGATGYAVYSSSRSGDLSGGAVMILAGSASSATLGGLKPGDIHYFTVRATQGPVASAPSNEVHVPACWPPCARDS